MCCCFRDIIFSDTAAPQCCFLEEKAGQLELFPGNSRGCSLGKAQAVPWEQQKYLLETAEAVPWEQQKHSLGTARVFTGKSIFFVLFIIL